MNWLIVTASDVKSGMFATCVISLLLKDPFLAHLSRRLIGELIG